MKYFSDSIHCQIYTERCVKKGRKGREGKMVPRGAGGRITEGPFQSRSQLIGLILHIKEVMRRLSSLLSVEHSTPIIVACSWNILFSGESDRLSKRLGGCHVATRNSQRHSNAISFVRAFHPERVSSNSVAIYSHRSLLKR